MGARVNYERQVIRIVGVAAVAIFALSALLTRSLSLSALAGAGFVAAALFYGIAPSFKYRDIPGPTPTIFSGNLSEFEWENVMKYRQRMAKEYTPLCRVQNGQLVSIMVTSLQDIEKVMSSDFGSFHSRALFMGTKRNNHLFEQVGEKWRKSRRTLMPSFNTGNLSRFTEAINATGRELADRLLATPTGKAIDVWRMYGDATMQVILSTSFGHDVKQTELGNGELVTAMQTILGTTSGAGFEKYLPYLFMFPWFRHLPSSRRKIAEEARSYIMKYTKNLVDKMRAGENLTEANRRSFLNLAVTACDKETGEGLDDEEIIAQSTLFMVAGYETTATTMAFLTGFVSGRPDVVEKIVEEIDRVCEIGEGDELPDITYGMIKRFEYLHQVVKETLRLVPPVPTHTRVCTDDGVTLGHGTPIAKGTRIYVPIYGIQRDPDIWGDDAEEFRPERWDPDSKTSAPGITSRVAYMPFGEGPRKCIGYRFAQEELIIILCHVFKRCKLTLAEPVDVRQSALLNPRNGVKVSVESR